jgi:hypothetical protein
VVGGDKARQVRTIFHHHRAVSAEAAGGHTMLLVCTSMLPFRR